MDGIDSPEIMKRIDELFAMLQEVAFVSITNQWRGIEIELAKLQATQPAAFNTIVEAWADNGWLVRPPWAPPEDE